jgi:hypothetical protein
MFNKIFDIVYTIVLVLAMIVCLVKFIQTPTFIMAFVLLWIIVKLAIAAKEAFGKER